MLKAKRVIIATICGFIFGIVCMLLASSNPDPNAPLTASMKWAMILGRTLLGFTIGISALRIRWWLHGLFIGIITSVPMALPLANKMAIMAGTILMGAVYGFLTELITSIIFKAKSAASVEIIK
jgi:MFS family permease